MLLKSYSKKISRPECNPGFQSLHCIAHLDQDITDVLPYPNSVPGGFEYFKGPGGEGKTIFKAHTKGCRGNIYKGAKVNTNDREQNVVNPGIKAFVKGPILISPRYVSSYCKAGQGITRVVGVKAALNNPLTLSRDQFDLRLLHGR